MQFQTESYNKMTAIKAAVTLFVVFTVIMVTAFSVWFTSKNAALKSALNAYLGWSDNLAASVLQKTADTDISEFTPDEYAALFQDGYNGFEGAAIVTVSGEGRFVFSSADGMSGKYLSDYGLQLPEEGSQVFQGKLGDKTYAFSLSPIDEDYYICGFIDFTESAAAINSLRASVITLYSVSAVVIIGAVAVYVLSTGLNERGHRYKYKFVTDVEGRILKSNKKFKEDFPQTMRLEDNVAHFSEADLNAVKLSSYEEDYFIACTAKKKPNGKIKFSADTLAMPYNAQATQPRDMMREAYVSLLPRGKAFLLGLVFMENLHNIKDMFGRDFAENIHAMIFDKVAERFKYIYNLDLYTIGVLFPDGKEYTVMLQDLKDFVASLNQNIKVDNNTVNMSVKCGFAICDNSMEKRSFDYAMTAADAALKRAVAEKLKSYYIFRGTEITQYAKYFFNYDLRQMLADNQFEMEYQPQYSVTEDRIVGFEALFRIKKSANIQVNIFDLISYAERSGNMVVLGDFIFDTAMRFAKRLEGKNVKVSLNVSPIQLMQAGFCDNFLQFYDSHELKPGSICVEITESFLVQNFDDVVQKLMILREHGIEIHLDDFGTRYSSLLYLKKLPVSVIKIDKEFISDIKDNPYDRSITDMILHICKSLNLTSISEGVETKEQYEILKDMGVDIVQGFLIGKSVPGDVALKLAAEFKLK